MLEMSWRSVGIILVSLVACGGRAKQQPQGDGSGAGGMPGGEPSAGGANGEAGSISRGGATVAVGGAPQTAGTASIGGAVEVGGDAGEGGVEAAGGATSCEPIDCDSSPCPGKKWRGLDGCPTCACEPPEVTLSHGSTSCPSESLTLTASASYYIGGVNRWLLQFDWSCSPTGTLGEPSSGELEIRLMDPLSPPLDAAHRTFYFGPWADTTSEPSYNHGVAAIRLRGSGVPEIESAVVPTMSFLSIRREGDTFVGGVYVEGTTPGGDEVLMAGPFEIAIPPQP